MALNRQRIEHRWWDWWARVRRLGTFDPSSPLLPILGLCLLSGLLALPARADGPAAEAAYRQGIEAADRQDWPTVLAAMTEAVSHRPEPGGRPVKIYGMRFEDYVPHYFLGRAHEIAGDCRSALDAWSTAGLEGALDQQRRSKLDGFRTRCNSRLASQPADGATESESLGPTVPAAAPEEEPSPRLRRAAADYLAGQYASVIRSADPTLEIPASRAEATAWLLRGAARFALHRQTGEVGLLEAARTDLATHRRLRPAERPSPYWFSPALLAFYDRAAAQ